MYINFLIITQIKVKYLKTQKICVKQDKIKKMKKKIYILVVLIKNICTQGRQLQKLSNSQRLGNYKKIFKCNFKISFNNLIFVILFFLL